MKIHHQHRHVATAVMNECYRFAIKKMQEICVDCCSKELDELKRKVECGVINIETMEKTFEILRKFRALNFDVEPKRGLIDKRDITMYEQLDKFFADGYGYYPEATR